MFNNNNNSMFSFLLGLSAGFIAFTDEGKKISHKALKGITGIAKNIIPQDIINAINIADTLDAKQTPTKDQTQKKEDNNEDKTQVKD